MGILQINLVLSLAFGELRFVSKHLILFSRVTKNTLSLTIIFSFHFSNHINHFLILKCVFLSSNFFVLFIILIYKPNNPLYAISKCHLNFIEGINKRIMYACVCVCSNQGSRDCVQLWTMDLLRNNC